MYNSFYGFKESPFNLTPDPRYLFLSHYHKEALDHLLYGVNERKGFITITGGIGTGKTTLCRAFLSRLNSSTKSALIFNSFISDSELLETINQEFDIKMDSADRSKKCYIDALNEFLLTNFTDGGNAVLLLDEAQNLSNTVLEQIRMLSNLETEREKLIQIILVGQPELGQILATPSLKQLDERITVRYDLKPLDRKDVQAYVSHRLVVAGSRGDLTFTRDACEKIYGYSQGNPRRINAVCDRSLLIAYTKETNKITKKVVGKAIQDIRGDLRADPLIYSSEGKNRQLVFVLLVLLVISAGLGAWNYRDVVLNMLPDNKKAIVVETVKSPPNHHKQKTKKPSLFLDGKTSLSALYDLFSRATDQKNYDMNQVHLGLVEFNIRPEYYVRFKKPFRVRSKKLSSSSLDAPGYLVISKVTEEGAIAMDANGKERSVMRNFIFDHWDGNIAWLYPFKDISSPLVEGMSGQEVLRVQEVLNEIGYLVKTTGRYGKSTSEQVSKFQGDFGLLVDGVVGPRTRALLYQFEGK
jgi:general secretion pathway protein A